MKTKIIGIAVIIIAVILFISLVANALALENVVTFLFAEFLLIGIGLITKD